MAWLRFVCMLLAAALAAPLSSFAQDDPPPPVIDQGTLGLEGLGIPRVGDAPFGAQHVTLSADYQYDKDLKKAKLSVTAQIDEGWHIYSLTQPKKEGAGPKATSIVVKSNSLAETKLLSETKSTAKLFRPDREPKIHIEKETPGWEGLELQEHENVVTWTVLVELAEGVKPEQATFEISVRGQVCQGQCINFKETLDVKFNGYAQGTPIPPAPQISTVDTTSDTVSLGLLGVLGLCLVGGFLLNLMPCVFPVLGLKVLSFAEQAGQSRGRVIALNVAYSAGLIAVFLVLATLVVVLSLKWGQQFTLLWFQATTAGVVFAMALSFLGVWEIPIPGFASSADGKQEEEGLAGSFTKGVFTTILATPCSGPFLGAVFSFTLGQPAYVTYLIFTFIGLGMSLPYLLVGVFPQMVRWLPKPGAWMETFKQLMGFVLLATVVYQFYIIKPDYFIPSLAMCFGIWFGCWIVGRVPSWEESGKRLRAWGWGLIAIAVITTASFHYLSPNPKLHLFEWTPYSSANLSRAQAEGKTVMVDFTAKWCLTCQYNFHGVINTEEIKQQVERLGVVPLLADWSEESEEIETKLDELKSNSIPLLAIYPANRPGEVILLRDLITKNQLLAALEKAGPSRTATPQ